MHWTDVPEVIEARKALAALYLMVPEEVMRDVAGRITASWVALSHRSPEGPQEPTS